MTYSATHHANALAYAPTVSRDRERDGGLSVWLTEQQDNRCFDCGNVRPLEFAHFVKVGNDNGRAAGSAKALMPIGAMACRDCNLQHDAMSSLRGWDSNLPLAYLMADGRADRIPTDYPTRAELVRIYKANVSPSSDARMAQAQATLDRLGL